MMVVKPRKTYPGASDLVEGLRQLSVEWDDIFVLRQGPEQDLTETSALAYDIAAVTRKYVVVLAKDEELSAMSRAELAELILGDVQRRVP